jgi:hypothetical protein
LPQGNPRERGRRCGIGDISMGVKFNPKGFRLDIVLDSPKDWRKFKDGAEAFFHPNGGKPGDLCGVKFFFSRANRDSSHYLQGAASKKKLAPKVGNKFKVFLEVAGQSNTARMYWGYYTEIANTRKRTNHKQREILCEKLDKFFYKKLLGASFVDMHSGNVGYLGNRLVCVDFGECSIED